MSFHLLRRGVPEDELRDCDVCEDRFRLRFAYQRVTFGDEAVSHVCSRACRETLMERGPSGAASRREPARIAVLNQKGGTGKTTTAIHLAAGLAEHGARVLLLDLDAQGHVSVSFGVKAPQTLYHVIVERRAPSECVVSVGENLDLLTSAETLASAEIYLARMDEGRDRILRTRMGDDRAYDFVVLDCGPSLSLLNMNALTYADHLLVPVSCDYLALVGVRQLLRTVRHVNELLLHPIDVLGVLPTFYDPRNRISDESIKSLQGYFHDKVLPPIRVNTRLKEAPSHGQTIYEYAPTSRGAHDYRKLVERVRELVEARRAPAVDRAYRS